MLTKIDRPVLLFDPLRERQPGATGFSRLMLEQTAAEVASADQAYRELVHITGRVAAGKVLEDSEYLFAAWQLNDSRLQRPLALMHVEAVQFGSEKRIQPIGTLVLDNACEVDNVCSECVGNVLDEVQDQLKNNVFGKDLLPTTGQIINNIR